MSKKTKLWIIIPSFLILISCIIFCVVMNKLNWDFTKLSTNIFETNKYEINDEFKDIKIKTNTADIEFILSENLNNLVVCNEQKNVNHSVEVKDNTLVIEVVDTRKWYEYIGINFNTPKITIYLPKSEYGELLIRTSTGDVKIPKDFKFSSIDILVDTGDIINYAPVYENVKVKTSTGDIYVENIIASMLELSTSTGQIDIVDVICSEDIEINVSTGKTNIVNSNCKNLLSSGSTGDIFMKKVIATEKFSIERGTGDVNFENCDASDIFIETDTGDVVGSLLTDKVVFAETGTGRIDVPKVIADEKCEIITDTGDIKITVE
ncbi:MAG: DUF4097 domain-containing protein [Clostridiales bacterium]|nr:DUF4097 domain-containing protein [Clostridiales bacterium]